MDVIVMVAVRVDARGACASTGMGASLVGVLALL
jgi:hypothetical protein